jgi:excinuclease ABC subunit A
MNKDISTELTNISVTGAREHNLKNISIDIPRDKFVVITGLSGSGKSSLAFDTLYAEGQRRYVESLSPYAKQFLGMHKRPDADKIEGLSPAISIEQKTISHNPRSTVGTTTEIYDYYRLLYAKLGVQYSIEHNVPVVKYSKDQIIEQIFNDYKDKKIQILAPVVKARKGHYRELFEQLIRQGFTKVRIDGSVTQLREGMKLSRYQIHDIEIVIDRTEIKPEFEHRISESLDLAIQKGEGIIIILSLQTNGTWKEDRFSTNYACPVSGKAYDELSPNMFSFNTTYGACKKCGGLGTLKKFKIEDVLDYSKSIKNGGVKPFEKNKYKWLWMQVNAFAEIHNIDLNKPLREYNEETLNNLLYGNDEDEVEIDYSFQGSKKVQYKQKFAGIFNVLEHLYENPPSNSIKKHLGSFISEQTCNICNGGRLNKKSLNVKIDNKNIHQITQMDVNTSVNYFKKLRTKITPRQKKIADGIFKEIISRLSFMLDVGLGYISLERSVKTLSGGESQRIRLASQIGSQLVGIMYVLDEPSIGLHQHDNDRLIQSLKKLRDLGNSVIVVEHDKAMIEQSDRFIDIGPKAGIHGGEIVLNTSPAELTKNNNPDIEKSLTAQYLLNKIRIEIPEKRRDGNGKEIVLKGAKGNNLKNVDLHLPLGKFVCVTGMSGSGKSTLINDTLFPVIAKMYKGKLYDRSQLQPLQYESIEGTEHIDKIIEIDQSPIGRTPRSNPATYTGLFTLIRDLFAMLPESKIRGYKPGRFSFNVTGGRCEECQGAGIKKIEMNFLADVYVKCDQCNGKRYNNETLQVKYNGKTISDVLDMTVEEALELFKDLPKISHKLKTINDVGLGYITLGQQAPTLSGGEAQRVKLSAELSKRSTGKTLYLLDEPTTGLHFEDIRMLLKLLSKLVDKGNTVIVIEHNLDVIKAADLIIDLGPEGGEKGGEIIAQGTPEEIIKSPKSYTGKYLKEELKNR